MTPQLLYQADRAWSRNIIALGPQTIGRVGCVLTSLVNAARDLGTRPSLTPPEANTTCVVADCFDGASLHIEAAAELFGLMAPYAKRATLAKGSDLRRCLTETLDARGQALLRVDYKNRGTPTDDGRHTILARGWTSPGKQQVECWCPAVGRLLLPLGSLEVDAVWGASDTRRYRVVKVHPVHKPIV